MQKNYMKTLLETAFLFTNALEIQIMVQKQFNTVFLIEKGLLVMKL